MAETKSKQGLQPNAKKNKGARLPRRNAKGGTSFWARLWAQRELWLMLLPGLAFYAIFRYGPMYGLRVAFQDYSPFLRENSPWVGFKHFEFFFSKPDFLRLLRNTLTLGGLSLFITFPVTIIFSLVLNEIRQMKAKKFYQTVSYLPTFFSIVIICSIFVQMFSVGGVVNDIIAMFGGERTQFLLKSEWYYFIYMISEVWAGVGSGAIIYLSALAGVDTQLYEAAELDGCTRMKRIIHITLPSIMPTIVTMFLLRVGNIIRIGADKTLLLAEPITKEVSDIFATYVYEMGILQGGTSYSAAIGMFESVVAATLLLIFNYISRKKTGNSLW